MENTWKKFGAFIRHVPISLKFGLKPPDYNDSENFQGIRNKNPIFNFHSKVTLYFLHDWIRVSTTDGNGMSSRKKNVKHRVKISHYNTNKSSPAATPHTEQPPEVDGGVHGPMGDIPQLQRGEGGLRLPCNSPQHLVGLQNSS